MNKKSNTVVSKAAKKAKEASKVIQYVIPIGNGWLVKNSRRKKFTIISDSKREAVMIARGLAKRQGTELIVYAKDGSIQEQVSYAV